MFIFCSMVWTIGLVAPKNDFFWSMEKPSIFINFDGITPPKTNMDLQNDGLEKVTPNCSMAIFGISWYIYVRFLG